MKKYLSLSLLALAMPLLVGAQAISDVSGGITIVKGWIESALPLLIGLAVIFFIWSLLQFLRDSGSKKDEARTQMIWGIVILFVMVSVWGLVGLLQNAVNTDNAPSSVTPTNVGGLIPN